MSAIRTVPMKLGLISVNVKVSTAIDDSTPRFNTVCDNQHAPAKVRQSLACPQCGNNDRSTFKKGADQGDGTMIVIDPDKLAEAAQVPEDVKGTITLTAHPSEDLSAALAAGKVYFLEPAKGMGDTYALMVELLRRRSDVALVTSFAIRGKPAMYRINALDDVLTMTELAWPNNVRPLPQYEGEADSATLDLAEKFVDTVLTEYDPTNYSDIRAQQLDQFLSTQKAVAAAEDEEVAVSSGDDLMAALEQVVAPKKKATKKATKKQTRKAS